MEDNDIMELSINKDKQSKYTLKFPGKIEFKAGLNYYMEIRK